MDYIYSTPDGHCCMICSRLAIMLIAHGKIELIDDSTLRIRTESCLPEKIIIDEYYLHTNPYETLTSTINLTECIKVFNCVINIEVKLMSEMNMNDCEDMILNSFIGYSFQDTFKYIPADSSDERFTYAFVANKLNLSLEFCSEEEYIEPDSITYTTIRLPDNNDSFNFVDVDVVCTLIYFSIKK